MSALTDLFALLSDFGSRLPPQLAFTIDNNDAAPGEQHPLGYEIEVLLGGGAASLPHVGSKVVTWVTVGPSSQALREAVTDLRCWIIPSLGWEAIPPVIVPGGGIGELSKKLLAVSPAGYFRWACQREDLDSVILKLRLMRQLANKAPPRSSRLRPTLEILRRQFTVGLATGDRALATEALDEIDRRQLDTAVNTLSMRIRRDEAFADNQAIVENSQLEHLLTFTLPRRVSAAIIRAHHAVFLADLEAVSDFERAAQIYRGTLYDRLAGLLNINDAGVDATLIRMVAYNAWCDGDMATLRHIARDDLVAAYLLASAATESAVAVAEGPEGPPVEPNITTGVAPQIAPETDATRSEQQELSWSGLVEAVLAKETSSLDAFLRKLSSAPDEMGRGLGDGASLLELFTDSRVSSEPEAAERAETVLTTVIDAYVCEPSFPQKSRLPLYDTILEIWLDCRAGSNDLADGQLMLMMSDAILRLDGTREMVIAERIRRWWKSRPVRARLTWLGEALELLTEHSVSKEYLALWYDAATMIKADANALGPNGCHLWVRLGSRLGLETAISRDALGIDAGVPTDEAVDPLEDAGFRKIAIVSLHEKAAREAANEIEERTGASVLVVTDYAAGDATQSAANADVILFVWGAAKHAVYRAFDKVRDRLEYVQGTGSGSIVRALERRVARSAFA